MLGKLLLADGDRPHRFVEDDCACRGGALVYRQHMTCHASPPLVISCTWRRLAPPPQTARCYRVRCLLPALDDLLIGDRLALGLLVFELGGRAVGPAQPFGRIL